MGVVLVYNKYRSLIGLYWFNSSYICSIVTKLNDNDCPQEKNISWALQSNSSDSDKPVLVYMKEQ